MERPRTHLVEIAIPYLEAKTRTAWLDLVQAGSQGVVLETIYATYKSSGEDGPGTSQLDVSRPAPAPHPNTQFCSGEYQGQQDTNSQQIPRQDPSLQSPQNETQSQQQRVQPQQAMPRAAHSHIAAFGKQHVTGHAPQLQLPRPQLPGHGTLGHPKLPNDSPQPSMTPIGRLGTPVSSIGQQSFDIPQFQPEEYTPGNPGNEFSMSLDSPLGSVSSDVAGIQEEYVAQHPDSPHVSVSSEALRIQEEDIAENLDSLFGSVSSENSGMQEENVAEEPRREENTAEDLMDLLNSSKQ
ncbi:hypothetical protein FPRO05_02444 [Fusarium proliferatum]|uniref:Uncharacterized protein n=1 Tax=Gibberella intermedia TaxID=948311 RepID=A0A365MYM4_GIBIN|nr:hypothetical protein FPRO05_02444 [Fusarium proliferatum]